MVPLYSYFYFFMLQLYTQFLYVSNKIPLPFQF